MIAVRPLLPFAAFLVLAAGGCRPGGFGSRPANAEAVAQPNPAAPVAPPVIRVSPEARAQLVQMADRQNAMPGWRVRLEVSPGGCTGMQTHLWLDTGPLAPADAESADGEVTCVYRRDQYPLVQGARIDWGRDGEAEGFRVTFPDKSAENQDGTRRWMEDKLKKMVAQAQPEKKPPSKKTEEAVRNLKADLSAFVVQIDSMPSSIPGGDAIQLMVDAKTEPGPGRRVFRITEKQAEGLIDYLADGGWFDRVYPPPPGILPPGWYIFVGGGGRSIGETRKWGCYWAYRLDDPPQTVGIIQHLVKTLEGDARAAVETFRKDAAKGKK